MYKIKFTQILANNIWKRRQTLLISWVTLFLSVLLIISKERQPENKAEQKGKLASTRAGPSSPTTHPIVTLCCTKLLLFEFFSDTINTENIVYTQKQQLDML